jgi:biotin carboxyl carrier protein
MAERHEIIIDGENFLVELEEDNGNWKATIEGRTYTVEMPAASAVPPSRRRSGGKRKKSGTVTTTIPGKVVTVEVTEGDVVEEGDVILILEAMKMQNEVLAPVSGTVINVNCGDGENVQANSTLVIIEPNEEVSE